MKKNIRKRILILFGLLTFIITSNLGILVTNAKTLDNDISNTEKYEVFNGYGELIYVSDSLEEAENYIAMLNSNGSQKSVSAVYKVAKTFFSKAATPIMITCVTYRVGQYILGNGDVKSIIDEIIPLSTLIEIANAAKYINVYSASSIISNPYPPHSYSGAMWNRTNFYYVTSAN